MIGSVPFDDRGLLLGDGLFETLLWQDRRSEEHTSELQSH